MNNIAIKHTQTGYKYNIYSQNLGSQINTNKNKYDL